MKAHFVKSMALLLVLALPVVSVSQQNSGANANPSDTLLLPENQSIVLGGNRYIIAEGDMLVRNYVSNDSPDAQDPENPVAQEDTLVVRPGELWPGGVVPYVFDGDIGNFEKDVMKGWIEEVNTRLKDADAPLKMVPRTREEVFVRIIYHKDFAIDRFSGSRLLGAATLGYKQGEVRYLLMSDLNEDTFKHEVMHVFGAEHEHSRDDRDQYVDKNPGFAASVYERFNLKIQTSGYKVGDYDINSIVHYDVVASDRPFSNNYFRAKPGVDILPFTERYGRLSEQDVAGLKESYSNPAVVNREIPKVNVLKPDAPQIQNGFYFAPGTVEFRWATPSSLLPIVGYEVFKNDERVVYIPAVKLMLGFLQDEDNFYVDKEIGRGQTAEYKIRAVDELGFRSNFSEAKTLRGGDGVAFPSSVSGLSVFTDVMGELTYVSWEASVPGENLGYEVKIQNYHDDILLTEVTYEPSYVFSARVFGSYKGLYSVTVTAVNGRLRSGRRTVTDFNDRALSRSYDLNPAVVIPDGKYNIELSPNEPDKAVIVVNGKFCENSRSNAPWAPEQYPIYISGLFEAINFDAIIHSELTKFIGPPCVYSPEAPTTTVDR